ncbi:MAG: VOC family protein [Acidobacteriia bacterium]|nr:VOC family protein [Terriglobia bacterium]
MNAQPALSAIGQIAVTVTDVERAIAFYRDVLGMKFLFQFPNLGFFDCAGVRLMLSGSEKFTPSDNCALYFKVEDIQQSHATLAGRGVAFESAPRVIARMPDHDLWIAVFRDPDRNLLALMCERSR